MARRRRRLAFLAVVLLGLAVAAVLSAPRISARFIARSLTSFFQRPSSVGRVRFHLIPFRAEVLDVRVAAADPAGPPFLEVPRIVAVPALGPMWGHRVVLSRLRLEGLRIRVNAHPEGGDDIPKMKTGGGGGASEFRIRRFLVDGGELVVNHRRVPLELDLPDFRARLAARRAGVLAGSVHFGPGRLQFGTAPPLNVATDVQLSADGVVLTAESGRLRTEGTDLAYSGRIRVAPSPQGEFQLKGPVDLDVLERHVIRTGFGLKGAARWVGSLSVDGSRLRLQGRLHGTAGVFDGVPVPRFAGDLSWDERGVLLRGLDVAALGGSATLDLDVPPGRSVARLRAEIQGVDSEHLVAAIFDIGTAGVAGAASGPVDIRWPRGRFRDLSGSFGVDLAPLSDGRTPLSGRFEWRAEDGVQFVDSADLRTPTTRARLRGRIERDDRTDLALDGESTDLAVTDDLLVRIRRALGVAEAQPAGFTGSGLFRGRWAGTLSVPVFQGRFLGQDVGYLGVVWGRAEWVGSADPNEVKSHSLVLRRPGAELWVDGRIETGYFGERDGIDVRVRMKEWPAADLAQALDWDVEIEGPVSGEAQVAGRRSAPEGWARIRGSRGRYYGYPYANLDVSVKLRPGLTEVREGRAQVGGGTVGFAGMLTGDGVYDAAARLDQVEIGEVVPARSPDVAWAGRISGEVTVQGTVERPRMSGRLTSPRLFLGDEGLGDLEATLAGTGDGSVRVEARCRSARVDLTLSGRAGAAPPYLSDLRLGARDTSLDPFLRPFLPELPSGGLVASGEVHIQGPLQSPERLEVQAEARSFELLLPDHPLRSQGTTRFTLEEGRLQVPLLHLTGQGTDLRVEGSAAVFENGPLDLSLRGSADLRTLGAVTGRLRGRGAARVLLTIGGTRDAPRAEGRLDVDGGGVRLRGFPHGLDDVRGSVVFTETGAHFSGLTATVGGGALELEGQIAYAKGRLTTLDVEAVGRGIALRYPEGLRSAVDADLKLFGDSARQWVTGTVDVKDAAWTRRYDVASELLSASEVRPERASLQEGMRYDVTVRAPGTLRIDNNLATLQARAELKLQGTYDNPVVLGRAEIDRGRVYFQGNTYVIRHGSIDFANPERIDPLFDIEAETRLRSYRVTLKVNGTLGRVYPTLTSDPPLSAVQILSLLAGADESTIASVDPAQQRQANLAATGAATLAAGRLAEEVGLERGAERLLGLNRFSIDPSLVRGTVTNPTARLTVGKRITPDLNVLYSQDLRGAEERLLSVEYTLSDRFSLLLTRAEPEGFGFDVRLRHTQ